MKEKIIKSLEIMTQTTGVSGHEQDIIRYLKDQFTPFADSVDVDNFGNLTATKQGKKPGLNLMIIAHADEIGFIVKNILDNGFIQFDKVGSASDKVMEGRKVFVNGKIPGIIGIKPGHLTSPEEGRTCKNSKGCYIDIAASTRAEVESLGIRIGDPIAYESSFTVMSNPDYICTKSLDNRVNCALLLEIFKNINKEDFEGTLTGVISVQEETGMKGAFVAGNRIKPDYAIVIDTIPAGDTPDINGPRELPVKLGGGPVCPVAEGIGFAVLFSYIHPKVRTIIENASKQAEITMQYAVITDSAYATDTARLNMVGTPCGTVAVPRRYSHSPVEMININDAVASYKILFNIVKANGSVDLSFI